MSDFSFAPDLPKTALVTGGAKRLGRAMSLALAEWGFAVAIHYNGSQSEEEALAEEIIGKKGRAMTVQADLAVEEAVTQIFPTVTKTLGPVGVLVNNASTFSYDLATTATRQNWDYHLEPNLRAPFVLSQDFAKYCPKDSQGLIVNMLDQRVWNLSQHFATYTISKSALWTMTQTLAMTLAPKIRVNGIGPGPALPSARQSQDSFDAMCRAVPLERGTTPEEVTRTLRFLLESPAITGQMIALDGGQHLGWGQPQWGAIAPPHSE